MDTAVKKSRIFFTADVHGSELCFRKFINTPRYYGCNVIMLSGDLTGKSMVPILLQADGTYQTEFLRRQHHMRSITEVEALEKEIRSVGYYPYRTTARELEALSKEAVDGVFKDLMVESISQWVSLAESHLKDTDVKCFMMPGNDDIFEIDPIFKHSTFVINPEGVVLRIDERHELISTGYTNITPWKCPRDIPEEELSDRIEKMASRVTEMKDCIFNFHCPPYGTNLDTATKLDENLRPVVQGSSIVPVSAGSTAVLEAIQQYQPLMGLHGHIHESSGFHKIGRTMCFNPGSEYTEGILRGFIIELDEKGIRDFTRVES
jgi:Icc-related predicted phosphoesterase